jgi:serine/threonine protein phosphatase 1
MCPALTYAIGDIHGCHDLLLAMLQGIEDHAAGQPYRLVFLGDYIDRGPNSAGVLATVRQRQEASPDTVVCLMGDHEALLLQAAADPSYVPAWLWNGGDAALASFGAKEVGELPPDLIDWLGQLPTFYEDEHGYYVHAGVSPLRSLDDQHDEDRLWIREAFLEMEHDFGKHIVHGHTPLRTDSPDERPYRTNRDTAAVYGGALTAGVFTSGQTHAVAFLRVLASP